MSVEMGSDWSLVPALFSGIAIVGIRKKAVWGPICAVWASLTWVVYGGLTDQTGIVLSELVFAALYTSTMVAWMRDADRS